MHCITYYSSYIYLFTSMYSYICLDIHCLTFATFFLFLSSIIHHSDRDNIIKLRIDEIIVRITILSYAYYFYDYCIPWISLLYMILSYYVFKGKFPKFSNIIHSSFHIVTGFTMIYLIHCI